ncbi:MAG: tetratricopeptide repeat protein [Myxococcota bacterium]|nr:tetratricopeptide repeat protein [Myxococcota bacterium]
MVKGDATRVRAGRRRSARLDLLLALPLALAVLPWAVEPSQAQEAVPAALAADPVGAVPSDPVGRVPAGEPSNAIEQAWFTPAENLEERVWRTRRTALARGVWNVDSAARALLGTASVPLDRAEAAVSLAPDLPAAQMALARALWLHGESPLGAIRRATVALGTFARHPEGGLWLGGSLLVVLATTLVAGGLLGIAVVSLFAAPHAAHDLGDLLSRRLPAFARAALLASLFLVAAVLGEGVIGIALGLLAIGVVYGSRRQRVALALASAAVVAGAFPVASLAGAALESLPSDPVAQAALATSRGFAFPEDVARLRAADPRDEVARQALARLARREGRMGEAYALYQALLEDEPEDLALVNNAANVRLHLGHMESALDLYRQALSIEESPVVLYNLAQAYGRAFQVDDLTETLEVAQAVDGELVADLTRLQGTQPEGFVLDLPIPVTALWQRVFDLGRGHRFAAELRAPVAPGRLGESVPVLAGSFAAVLVLGALIGTRHRASRWCARCGSRVCPRCHPEVSGGELCGPCHKLFYQPEQTDRDLRLARIEALRERESRLDKVAWLVSLVLPGAAGVLSKRPIAALLGAFFFAAALAAFVWRQGAVPDPLVAGAAGPIAFFFLAALAGLAYAVVIGTCLAARRHL